MASLFNCAKVKVRKKNFNIDEHNSYFLYYETVGVLNRVWVEILCYTVAENICAWRWIIKSFYPKRQRMPFYTSMTTVNIHHSTQTLSCKGKHANTMKQIEKKKIHVGLRRKWVS